MATVEDSIESKLDLILKLLASAVIANKKQEEKILYLSSLGFPDNDIAAIVGVKAVTVRATKSHAKKKKPK